MSSETIIKCLSQPSQDWEKMVNQYSNLKEIETTDDHLDKIKELYTKTVVNVANPVSIEEMMEISKTISDAGESYRHNDY